MVSNRGRKKGDCPGLSPLFSALLLIALLEVFLNLLQPAAYRAHAMASVRGDLFERVALQSQFEDAPPMHVEPAH